MLEYKLDLADDFFKSSIKHCTVSVLLCLTNISYLSLYKPPGRIAFR